MQSNEDMRVSESFSPIKRNNLINPRSVIFASKYSKESIDQNEMNKRKLKRVTLEDVKLTGLSKKYRIAFSIEFIGKNIKIKAK